jgi:glyoxylase I family protein
MRLRVGRVLVLVTDLDEAVRFYGDVLDMKALPRSGRRATFAGEGFVHAAFLGDEPGDPETHASRAGSTVAFEVESVEASAAELKERGVEFLHSQAVLNDLGRYIAFKDPFGVVHELFEPIAD